MADKKGKCIKKIVNECLKRNREKRIKPGFKFI